MSLPRDQLHTVMTELKLKHFQLPEIAFLREWAQIMGIVARALDIIQGEKTSYLGCLLLVVVASKMKLSSAKEKNPVYCLPLVDAMLDEIDKRCRHLMDDLDCQLASGFHPKFRMRWLQVYESLPGSDSSQSWSSKVRIAMEKAVESALLESEEEARMLLLMRIQQQKISVGTSFSTSRSLIHLGPA